VDARCAGGIGLTIRLLEFIVDVAGKASKNIDSGLKMGRRRVELMMLQTTENIDSVV
jgi:hypothetical protein